MLDTGFGVAADEMSEANSPNGYDVVPQPEIKQPAQGWLSILHLTL
jgi:hypothetical protein